MFWFTDRLLVPAAVDDEGSINYFEIIIIIIQLDHKRGYWLIDFVLLLKSKTLRKNLFSQMDKR